MTSLMMGGCSSFSILGKDFGSKSGYLQHQHSTSTGYRACSLAWKISLLAPTGALIVMMVYYTYTVQLFEFSLSPLMQLMLQVSL